MADLFSDSENLRGQSFAYGLAAFDRVATDSEEFVEAGKVSVFVDEEGDVNVDGKINLFTEQDPIDAIAPPTFSKGNSFIEGLNKAITSVPIGGIILYPTYNPRSVPNYARRNWLLSTLGPRYQGRTIYPRDTPPGFVPCVGQVLTYSDGSAFQVVDMPPPITSWGEWQGGRLKGGFGTNYAGGSKLPVVRYLQRVPEDWEKPDPVLGGAGELPLDIITSRNTWLGRWG